ncbi:MAG: hypothetical protein IJN16_11840, partial [Lachnospiraceae bacterium]|nr:hypothetical protein [Lachnospiraceae bacterium]
MKKPRISIFISSILFMLLCCGCGQQPTDKETMTQEPQSGYDHIGSVDTSQEPQTIVYGPDSYDSEDIAILLNKNPEENTVTLYNMEVDKQYTLQVAGTSTLYDKYGEPIALGQLQPGEIVEVTFLKDIKRLNSMQISPESWSNTAINRYEMDWEKKNLLIGADVYNLPEDVVILSGGKVIEPIDLNAVDTLSFRGRGNDVYSIVVEQGHGYLRLENDVNFIGGFIEIGQSIIHKIQEDMLLA